MLSKGVEVGSQRVCAIHWPSARELQCVTVLSELRFLMQLYRAPKICSLLLLALQTLILTSKPQIILHPQRVCVLRG